MALTKSASAKIVAPKPKVEVRSTNSNRGATNTTQKVHGPLTRSRTVSFLIGSLNNEVLLDFFQAADLKPFSVHPKMLPVTKFHPKNPGFNKV